MFFFLWVIFGRVNIDKVGYVLIVVYFKRFKNYWVIGVLFCELLCGVVECVCS